METTRDDPSPRSPADSRGGEPGVEAEDPGAWSTAALTLLIALFLLATAATVHSMIVTFSG